VGLVLVLLNIHNERSFRGLVSNPSFFPGHLCCLFIGSSVVLAMVETSSFGEMSHAPPKLFSGRASFWCHDTFTITPLPFFPASLFPYFLTLILFWGIYFVSCIVSGQWRLVGSVTVRLHIFFFYLCILMRLLHLGPLHLAFFIFVLLPVVSTRHFIKVRSLIHCIHESKSMCAARCRLLARSSTAFLGFFFSLLFSPLVLWIV